MSTQLPLSALPCALQQVAAHIALGHPACCRPHVRPDACSHRPQRGGHSAWGNPAVLVAPRSMLGVRLKVSRDPLTATLVASKRRLVQALRFLLELGLDRRVARYSSGTCAAVCLRPGDEGEGGGERENAEVLLCVWYGTHAFVEHCMRQFRAPTGTSRSGGLHRSMHLKRHGSKICLAMPATSHRQLQLQQPISCLWLTSPCWPGTGRLRLVSPVAPWCTG